MLYYTIADILIRIAYIHILTIISVHIYVRVAICTLSIFTYLVISSRSEPKEGRKLTNLVAGSLRTTHFHLATVSNGVVFGLKLNLNLYADWPNIFAGRPTFIVQHNSAASSTSQARVLSKYFE